MAFPRSSEAKNWSSQSRRQQHSWLSWEQRPLFRSGRKTRHSHLLVEWHMTCTSKATSSSVCSELNLRHAKENNEEDSAFWHEHEKSSTWSMSGLCHVIRCKVRLRQAQAWPDATCLCLQLRHPLLLLLQLRLSHQHLLSIAHPVQVPAHCQQPDATPKPHVPELRWMEHC